jgi:undecaprenyl-diphosphatase
MLLLSMAVLALGGIWGFVTLASEISEGEVKTFDETVLLALRNPTDHAIPLGPPWLQETMLEFTALGSTAVLSLITVGVVGWLLLLRKYKPALLAVLAIAGGALISTALKSGFARARPDLVPHGDVVTSMSFPSGHAMSSAVVYLTLAALLVRVQTTHRRKVYLMAVAIVLTLLIGVSRVYLGVHWPSDVLAGWCLGSAWALLTWIVALWWTRWQQRPR